MQELVKLLRRTELFRDFPEELLRREVIPHGNIQELARGQFLIEPQQRVADLRILLTGRVHIKHLFSDGKDSLMTALGPGEILGIDLVCTRSRISPYHAEAVMATRVIAFPAELVTRPGILTEEYRLEAIDHLLMMISQHNMKKEYRLAILSRKGLRERIVTYLSMQAAKRGCDTFDIPFTREELASFLCVNRSALSHELSLMEQEGLIAFRKNRFTLKTRAAQDVIADGL